MPPSRCRPPPRRSAPPRLRGSPRGARRQGACRHGRRGDASLSSRLDLRAPRRRQARGPRAQPHRPRRRRRVHRHRARLHRHRHDRPRRRRQALLQLLLGGRGHHRRDRLPHHGRLCVLPAQPPLVPRRQRDQVLPPGSRHVLLRRRRFPPRHLPLVRPAPTRSTTRRQDASHRNPRSTRRSRFFSPVAPPASRDSSRTRSGPSPFILTG